jgi:site-specific recombinase XerD
LCGTQVCSNSRLYGGITIKKRVKQDWSLPIENCNFKPNIAQFQHYLVDNGFMESTIDSYLTCAAKYLEFAKTGSPSKDMAENFRATLHVRKLSRSSINNYCSAIKNYHAMLGEKISFPYLRLKETIPYYFSQDEVLGIFSVINNFKHYAMFSTLFYGCLRVSEFCALTLRM